jgi:hypothetical protein
MQKDSVKGNENATERKDIIKTSNDYTASRGGRKVGRVGSYPTRR